MFAAQFGGLTGITRHRETGTGLSLVIILWIFAEHLSGGANRDDLALCCAAVHCCFLAALLLTPFGADVWTAHSRRLIVLGALFGVVLAELIAAFILSHAIDPQAHWIGVLSLLGLAALFVSGVILGGRKSCARKFLSCFVLCGGLFSFWSLIQRIFLRNDHQDVSSIIRVGRLSANFVSPNVAATLYGVIFLLALAGCVQRRSVPPVVGLNPVTALDRYIRVAKVELGTLLLSGACCLMTGSRAGIGFLIVAAIIFLGWQHFKAASAGRRMTPAIIAMLSLGIFAAGSRLVFGRLTIMGDDLAWRLDLWRVHWQAFRASPWWGYGLGSFPEINDAGMSAANMPHLILMGALHNVYLQWLEQSGLLGSVPMALCNVWIFSTICRTGFRKGDSAIWLRGLTLAGVFVAFHASVDYALEVPSVAAMASLLLGVGYGLCGPGSAERNPPAMTEYD